MNPLIIALTAAGFSILGAALSAMGLARFSSVEQRLSTIEGHLIHRGEKHG